MWIQKYKPAERLFFRRVKISEFIVNETLIKVGYELMWFWVGIAPKSDDILGMSLSKWGMVIIQNHLSLS